MADHSRVAPISLAGIQRARQALTSARNNDALEHERLPGDGPPYPHPPVSETTFTAGDLVSNSAGTGFLLDDMGGKLIARGFGEHDTWDTLFGNAAVRTIGHDSAWKVLDGYEVMESGAFIGAIYGVGSYWLVEGGRARGIVSPEAFAQYHFNADNVRWVPESLIVSLSRDEKLFIRTSTLSRTWKSPKVST